MQPVQIEEFLRGFPLRFFLMPFQIAPVKFRKKKIAPIKTKEKRHLTTRISVLPHSYNSIWWVNVTIPSKQKSNNLFFLYRLKSYTGHVCKSPHYIIPTKGIKKKSMDSSTYKQPIYSGRPSDRGGRPSGRGLTPWLSTWQVLASRWVVQRHQSCSLLHRLTHTHLTHPWVQLL